MSQDIGGRTSGMLLHEVLLCTVLWAVPGRAKQHNIAGHAYADQLAALAST